MTSSASSTRQARTPHLVVMTCVALGSLTLTFGLWALLAPESFFAVIAPFEPYNRHLIHDTGALQVGMGVALLLAAARRGSVVVALGGFVAFEGLHVVSHVLDRDLGGRPLRDLTFLALLAAVGAAALLVSRTERSAHRSHAVEMKTP